MKYSYINIYNIHLQIQRSMITWNGKSMSIQKVNLNLIYPYMCDVYFLITNRHTLPWMFTGK